MHDQPSAAELVNAVRSFIRETARPQLSGHAAFHARVAENALAIVERELASRPRQEAEEAQRLAALVDIDGSPDAQSQARPSDPAGRADREDTPGCSIT